MSQFLDLVFLIYVFLHQRPYSVKKKSPAPPPVLPPPPAAKPARKPWPGKDSETIELTLNCIVCTFVDYS